MSWREELQEASFRGAKFGVDQASTGFGRRNILHQYPQRDTPFSEDLGKQARNISITAFVIGDNYVQAKADLMRAIEEKNTPGTLIHPTLGAMQVIPVSCRNRFSNTQGGIEFFELTFSEAGENQFPNRSFNTRSKVMVSALASRSTVQNQLANVFKTSKLPQFISDDVFAQATELKDLILDKMTTNQIKPIEQGKMKESLDKFEATVTANIADPAVIASTFDDLVYRIENLYNDALEAFSLFKALLVYGDTLDPIPQTTASRIQQKINRDSLIRLTHRAALIGMAVTATRIDFVSYNDAVSLRNELADLLDVEILATGETNEDDSLIKIEQLRADMVADITTRGGSLRRIKRITLDASAPSLVIAYDFYDDAAFDAEINARNNLRRPLFTPAGQEIEVLL